jgi:hypothetical protein
MELYLLIGLFIGMIMVGIYWALPVATTGPKSLGRVALIMISAPFIWPVQIAYYAVRIMVRGKEQ